MSRNQSQDNLEFMQHFRHLNAASTKHFSILLVSFEVILRQESLLNQQTKQAASNNRRPEAEASGGGATAAAPAAAVFSSVGASAP